jgi:DNA sulfur modification protein DndD
LSQTVEEFREDVRNRVEINATQMFLRLIRDPEGYGGLRIGADYEIQLLDTRGKARQTSQGGKQLLALSLIGALKQAAVRGGPVVLDSPLGRLDLEHRENVLKNWIPALGGQAVLLVQSGELTREAAESALDGLIGREYQIVRPSNDPELVVIEGVG